MAQPCPSRFDVGTRGESEKRQKASRRGDFRVLAKPVRLQPPVDWEQDPYNSEAWRSKLQAWVWMPPLLARFQAGDRSGLEQARDLALDWISENPPEEGDGWKNKVAGNRAVYLGYLTRAAACRRVLSREQATTLLGSVMAHARFLAKEENDKFGNHGLFVAEGLLVVSGYMPFLREAPRWHRLASRRAARGLSRQVQTQEGVDLEHSPGYHFLVINFLDRLQKLPGQDSPELARLDRRMRRVAPWFVMPDGYITRLGDTARKPAPPWASQRSRSYRGLSPTRRSGFAIVKQPNAYLSVAAGYHRGAVHKQADELTFELYDRGGHIVTDTGRYGAARDKKDPAKRANLAFTKSSQAHSGLLVDNRNVDFKEHEPYGSAIDAVGQGDGWYAIEGRNPLVEEDQGVKHRRVFLYRPGTALIVVDLVRSAARHTYTRQFQFHPRIRVTRVGTAMRLQAPGFSGWLTDAPAPGQLTPTLVKGRRNPLLGWTTSANKFVPFIPRFAAQYPARAASAQYVAVIGLRGRATARLVSAGSRQVRVQLQLPGQAATVLVASRRGERLQLSQGG